MNILTFMMTLFEANIEHTFVFFYLTIIILVIGGQSSVCLLSSIFFKLIILVFLQLLLWQLQLQCVQFLCDLFVCLSLVFIGQDRGTLAYDELYVVCVCMYVNDSNISRFNKCEHGLYCCCWHRQYVCNVINKCFALFSIASMPMNC